MATAPLPAVHCTRNRYVQTGSAIGGHEVNQGLRAPSISPLETPTVLEVPPTTKKLQVGFRDMMASLGVEDFRTQPGKRRDKA